MLGKTCDNCCFYRYGDCRRYPPVKKYLDYAGEKWAWGWPQVNKENWCGEHRKSVEEWTAK